MSNVIFIAGQGMEWLRTCYYDSIKNNQIVLLSERNDLLNKLDKVVFRVCQSHKINRFIKLYRPQKWYKKFTFAKYVEPNEKIYLILMGGTALSWDKSYLEYIRSKYPNIKIAVQFLGLLKIYQPVMQELKITASDLLEWYDSVFTFDENDVDEFHFSLPNTDSVLYSHYATNGYFGNELIDLSYIGHCKDRLTQIYEVYDRFEGAGMKCKFFIKGVNKRDHILRNGISYISDVPYEYARDLANHSKCVLELLQKGQKKSTIRYYESLSFNTLFLTNNSYIVEDALYDADRVKIISNDASDIDFVRNTVPQFRKDLVSKFSSMKYVEEMLRIMDGNNG